MRLVLYVVVLLACVSQSWSSGEVKKLQIGVKHRPSECSVKAAAGDKVSVHYEGKLTDGTIFDSSYERGDPISFGLGAGQVIQADDLVLCSVGEKRKLKIPSHLGYGAQGSPPKIPGGATLVFDTELVSIN